MDMCDQSLVEKIQRENVERLSREGSLILHIHIVWTIHIEKYTP